MALPRTLVSTEEPRLGLGSIGACPQVVGRGICAWLSGAVSPCRQGFGASASCPHPPLPCVPAGDRAAYCRAANKRVMDVINSARVRQQVLHAQTFHGDSLLTQEDAAAAGDRRPAPDTWIYPLIQMKPFEIQIDEIVTETLLTEAERGARVYLTTGYFNLTQAYMDLVLGTRAEYQILLASPEVNGFFGAKGVAGAIPAAYVHIERQFFRELCSLGQQERVRLQEYWRRGWTFHAKGTQGRPAPLAPVLPAAVRARPSHLRVSPLCRVLPLVLPELDAGGWGGCCRRRAGLPGAERHRPSSPIATVVTVPVTLWILPTLAVPFSGTEGALGVIYLLLNSPVLQFLSPFCGSFSSL